MSAAPPLPPAPLWEQVETAEALTPAFMLDALAAMEIARARNMDEHVPAALRIRTRAVEIDRADLDMRARLILADVESRKGSPLVALKAIQEVAEQAKHGGYPYIQARSSFLQCVSQFALGDLPAARIHGVQAVEALPDEAPIPIRIDHLIMLAVAFGPGRESAVHYREALDLTAAIGDTARAVGIHNNLAYFAWQSGDRATALEQVQQMLTLSKTRGIPLKASSLDTVARVYIDAGRYDDAIDVLGPAVEDGSPVFSNHPGGGVLHTEPYALPECLLTLAAAHRLLGSLDSAAACLDRATALATERDLRQTGVSALEERAKQQAARGDWRRAYETHIAFHDAATHLHTAEQEARARAIQAGYDAGERERDSARFRELAIRDALTGLYNRRFIDTQMTALTAQSVANRTALSVAIVDADFFKHINDECSHDVGDRVLQSMASILDGAVVTPETVGRLGGEEFVVLMPGIEAAAAFERCEQMRRLIQDHDWSPLVGDLSVTVSVGVSTAANGQTSAAAILSDADRNLYAAKRSGRNRVMADTR